MGGMKLSRNVLKGGVAEERFVFLERLGRTELLSLHKRLLSKNALNHDQVTLMSRIQEALQALDRDHQSVLAYGRSRA